MITKVCSKCFVEKILDDFCNQKRGKYGKHSQCRKCRKAQASQYYSIETNRIKNLNYSKQYSINNKEKFIEYRAKNSRKVYESLWRDKNRERYNFLKAKRRAYKICATPKWLSKTQLKDIENFYVHAKECEMLTGDKYHVDHIIPLKGKNVCGLHVPWNLQVLPADINIKKGNKLL